MSVKDDKDGLPPIRRRPSLFEGEPPVPPPQYPTFDDPPRWMGAFDTKDHPPPAIDGILNALVRLRFCTCRQEDVFVIMQHADPDYRIETSAACQRAFNFLTEMNVLVEAGQDLFLVSVTQAARVLVGVAKKTDVTRLLPDERKRFLESLRTDSRIPPTPAATLIAQIMASTRHTTLAEKPVDFSALSTATLRHRLVEETEVITEAEERARKIAEALKVKLEEEEREASEAALAEARAQEEQLSEELQRVRQRCVELEARFNAANANGRPLA